MAQWSGLWLEVVMAEHDVVGGEGWREVVAVLMKGSAARAEEVFLPWQVAMYWEHKDVPGVVAMSQVCIADALAAAGRVGGEEGKAWRTVAKKMAYNLGSFTWTGWREEGVTITAAERAAGLEAATLNLKLTGELQRGAKGMANAWWLLGAQRLAAGDATEAAAAFREAQKSAAEARDVPMEKMMAGYVEMARLVETGGDRAGFEAVVNQLETDGSEDASENAAQLRVAAAEFVKLT